MRLLVTMAALSFAAAPVHAGLGDEVVGPRSTAMGGAHSALGTSNDALVLNSAGMAIGQRYSLDFVYGFSPYDSLSRLQFSVVDSKTGPVAGGVGYAYTFGNPSGLDPSLHHVYGAAAYRLFDVAALGLTVEHINGSYMENGEEKTVALYTGDIGLLVSLGNVNVAVAYQNIVRTEVMDLTPPSILTGAAVAFDSLSLAVDVSIDMRHRQDKPVSVRAGGEYFFSGGVPVRLGYNLEPYTARDGTRQNEHGISAGLGYLSPSGGAELSYQQSVTRPNNWGFVAAFKVFF